MNRQTLKAAAYYFFVVFGTGFVLGIVRALWILPRMGPRISELLEMPIMFVVSVWAARWVAQRFPSANHLSIGFVALGFLLLAEFAFAWQLRHLTPVEYITRRDPFAGTVYALLLGVFALLPARIADRREA